jgi:hypothetical protein
MIVHEGVGVKAEGLGRKLHHCGKKGGAWHVGVRGKPSREPVGNAICLWHTADSNRMLHDPFAFGHGKLAQQKKAFARRGGHPIGIAAARVEECRLRGARRLLGQADQLVLDFEWAQRFEFAQCEDVGHAVLLGSSVFGLCAAPCCRGRCFMRTDGGTGRSLCASGSCLCV